MTRTLLHELQQTKPFSSLEEEAVLSIMRTAAVLDTEMAEFLKPHGLTVTQYNVLRILRGAGESGLCRFEVAERLISPGPDVTRLIDRLESAGFVGRVRDLEDRRQVRTRITPDGMNVLETIEDGIVALHRHQIGHLSPDRLQTLVDLLSEARQRP